MNLSQRTKKGENSTKHCDNEYHHESLMASGQDWMELIGDCESRMASGQPWMDLIGDYNMRSLLGIGVPKLMEMEGGR